MKKYKFLLIFIFGFFLFLPKDTYAFASSDMSVVMFHTDGTTNICNNNNFCSDSSGKLTNRVSIKYSNYSIIQNSKYQLSTSILLWLPRQSLGITNNFYVGNYAGNSWNSASSVSWNKLDSVTFDELRQLYVLNWGLVQNFTSNISSNGITFDFYFTTGSALENLQVTRFDIVNTGNTTNDAINNSTNAIINNSNSNTDKITGTVDEFKDEVTNSKVDDNVGNDFFENDNFKDNTGLDKIVSLPLDFIKKIDGACQPLNLKIPYFNVELKLPCMSSIFKEKTPTIYNILKTFVNGLILYRCILQMYFIVRSARNPIDDRIEVLDL